MAAPGAARTPQIGHLAAGRGFPERPGTDHGKITRTLARYTRPCVTGGALLVRQG